MQFPKLPLVFLIIITLLSGCLENNDEEENNNTSGTKILMIVLPVGFSQEEFNNTKIPLEEAGVQIVIGAPSNKTEPFTNLSIPIDQYITREKRITVTEYDALVMMGGYDTEIYLYNEALWRLIKDCYSINKIIAAIGTAPVIITYAITPLVQGKSIACDPSLSDLVTSKGALYHGEGVAVEELLITASGEDYVTQFTEKILQALIIIPPP